MLVTLSHFHRKLVKLVDKLTVADEDMATGLGSPHVIKNFNMWYSQNTLSSVVLYCAIRIQVVWYCTVLLEYR